MFESVHVNASSQFFQPTAGAVAELLLFYDQVNLTIPPISMNRLLRSFDPYLSEVADLVERKRLNFLVDAFPTGEVALTLGLFGPPAEGWHAPPSLDSVAETLLEDLPTASGGLQSLQLNFTPSKGTSRSLERIFSSTVYASELYDDYLNVLLNQCQQRMADLASDRWFLELLAAELKRQPEQLSYVELDVSGMVFRGVRTGMSLYAGGHVLEALSKTDMLFACSEGDAADTYTTAETEDMFRSALARVASRFEPRAQLELFQSSAFGSSLARAIDGGQIDLKEVFDLLGRREAFANMVRGFAPDVSLARQYHRELFAPLLGRTILGKGVRWSCFAGLGAWVAMETGDPQHGVIASTGLGVCDAMFFDILVGRRKAKLFIENDLERVLNARPA